MQVNDIVRANLNIELIDINGRLVLETTINKGQTIAYFDTQAIYEGVYMVRISNGTSIKAQKIVIRKD